MSLSDQLKDRLRQAEAADRDKFVEIYKELHANPELSHQEEKTGARLAEEMEALGLETHARFGEYGAVGVLANGDGPTLLIRADFDALPIVEETGLPYASKVKALDKDGVEVGVMHACGHDVHAANLLGVARLMIDFKDDWAGKILFVAQPAEEDLDGGAAGMLKAGLYEKLGRPDWAVALHVAADMAYGVVGLCPGYASSASSAIKVLVRGIGGHGAMPQTTTDPVTLAAQMVLAFQRIISREVSPNDMAVMSVGAIHGGTKYNIIPEEVELKITLRSQKMEVKQAVIEKIRRVAAGLAMAAGTPEDRMPIVEVVGPGAIPIVNDLELTDRAREVFADLLGADKVVDREPLTGSEDFSDFGAVDPPVPTMMYSLGSLAPERLAKYRAEGKTPPTAHTPLYYPDPDGTISAGRVTMAALALDLLAK